MNLDERISLHALGALEPDERVELEKLAADDPAVRARLREERALARALLNVEPVAPSAALERRIMNQVDAEVTPLSKRQFRPAPAPAAARPGASAFDWVRLLFFGLTTITSVAAIAVGLSLIQTQRQLSDVKSQLTEISNSMTSVQTENARLEREINTLRNDLSAAERNASRNGEQVDSAARQLVSLRAELGLITQAGVRTAALDVSKGDFAGGTVTVFYAPGGRDALVSVAGLKPLGPNQAYQLWLIQGDNPLPSVVFNTDANGTVRVHVPADLPFGDYQAVGVTVEDADGNPTPNPEGPIFLGKLG
jgi:anti-sigma-K factor RskA